MERLLNKRPSPATVSPALRWRSHSARRATRGRQAAAQEQRGNEASGERLAPDHRPEREGEEGAEGGERPTGLAGPTGSTRGTGRERCARGSGNPGPVRRYPGNERKRRRPESVRDAAVLRRARLGDGDQCDSEGGRLRQQTHSERAAWRPAGSTCTSATGNSPEAPLHRSATGNSGCSYRRTRGCRWA